MSKQGKFGVTITSMFEVSIVWGEKDASIAEDLEGGAEVSRHEAEDLNSPITYSFNTQAELDAFLKGVDEGNGWMNYHVISDTKAFEANKQAALAAKE